VRAENVVGQSERVLASEQRVTKMLSGRGRRVAGTDRLGGRAERGSCSTPRTYVGLGMSWGFRAGWHGVCSSPEQGAGSSTASFIVATRCSAAGASLSSTGDAAGWRYSPGGRCCSSARVGGGSADRRVDLRLLRRRRRDRKRGRVRLQDRKRRPDLVRGARLGKGFALWVLVFDVPAVDDHRRDLRIGLSTASSIGDPTLLTLSSPRRRDRARVMRPLRDVPVLIAPAGPRLGRDRAEHRRSAPRTRRLRRDADSGDDAGSILGLRVRASRRATSSRSLA